MINRISEDSYQKSWLTNYSLQKHLLTISTIQAFTHQIHDKTIKTKNKQASLEKPGKKKKKISSSDCRTDLWNIYQGAQAQRRVNNTGLLVLRCSSYIIGSGKINPLTSAENYAKFIRQKSFGVEWNNAWHASNCCYACALAGRPSKWHCSGSIEQRTCPFKRTSSPSMPQPLLVFLVACSFTDFT